MAKKTFLADLDLALNQLLAARFENLAAAPAHAVGRIYYNTADKKIWWSDGTTWYSLINSNDSRLTDARTPTMHVLATNVGLGPEHSMSGATAGHALIADSATAAKFQQMDHVNLGNKGTNDHNAIDTHIALNAANAHGQTGFGAEPGAVSSSTSGSAGAATTVSRGDHSHDLGAHAHTGATDGGQINHAALSNVGTNTHAAIDTHIADATKHRIINDAAIAGNTTDLFSADKILSLISGINSTISGALVYKGGYDAAANNPLLDATPIGGIKQGWTYVVTAAGTFFSEDVQVGDMIIAKQDNPTLASHWTCVNKNIPDIISATEGASGIISIATQAEVNTGTNDTKAVTPLKLKTVLGTTATLSLVRKFSQDIGDGAALTYAVTHNLGTSAVTCQINRKAAPFDQVECEVVITSANVVTFNFNVAPTASQFTVIIMG